MSPSDFMNKNKQEKAFIIACIDKKMEAEKAARPKIGSARRRKRR